MPRLRQLPPDAELLLPEPHIQEPELQAQPEPVEAKAPTALQMIVAEWRAEMKALKDAGTYPAYVEPSRSMAWVRDAAKSRVPGALQMGRDKGLPKLRGL